MRVIPVTVACVAVLLAGCGTATTPGAGTGPSAVASTTTGRSPAPPPAVPAADGPVTGVGTVLEVPSGSPELCVGPVMESYPPQCEGIPLAGWDWAEAGVQEEVPAGAGSATRWGTYAVTGSFDGLGMTVTASVPLALYDTVARPSPRPVSPPALTPGQWAAVEAGVRLLPGLLTSAREGEGPVHVEVVHDDGSLQDWADAAFGAGAVRVTSALR